MERELRAIVARDPDGAVNCAAHQIPPRERERHGADRRRVVDRAQQSAAGQLIHLDHAAAGDRDAVATIGDHRNRGGEAPFDRARARQLGKLPTLHRVPYARGAIPTADHRDMAGDLRARKDTAIVAHRFRRPATIRGSRLPHPGGPVPGSADPPAATRVEVRGAHGVRRAVKDGDRQPLPDVNRAAPELWLLAAVHHRAAALADLLAHVTVRPTCTDSRAAAPWSA